MNITRFSIMSQKYENITKAAMVLKSSQPNVTRIIHILEDQLDCRYFSGNPGD